MVSNYDSIRRRGQILFPVDHGGIRTNGRLKDKSGIVAANWRLIGYPLSSASLRLCISASSRSERSRSERRMTGRENDVACARRSRSLLRAQFNLAG